MTAAPFAFPARYEHARAMIAKNVRVFRTTSMGRLFDTVAALLGFTREITFEGQAAMWLESLHERLGTALWVNRVVPANDGGLCLGQVALAAARYAGSRS